jgi:hypothetical protein
MWRIVEMELWDKDYIDLEGPGFIKFDKGGKGHFRFGAVQGDLDCRVENYAETERIEFSWEGNNDADHACGRGWAVLRNGTLHGRLLFHRGDESSFRATQPSRSNHTPNTDARKSGARRLA